MHFHVELAVPTDKVAGLKGDALEAVVSDYLEGKASFDWLQVGGLWRGIHDPTYDSSKDPALIETCGLCGGTGTRPDAASFGNELVKDNNGCNGCQGTGKSQKWPTQWDTHKKDVIPVSECPEKLDCYQLVAGGGTVEEVKDVRAALKKIGILNKKYSLITVDCHD